MWNELKMEINLCNNCTLSKIRKNAIIGEGNKKGKILFLMDNISLVEDKKGKLLVDKKGEYFKKFLEYSKLDLSKCYFTTLTKCSNNDELISDKYINNCFDYLIGQIALINPKFIITVGEIPTKKILNIDDDIHNMVGKVYDYIGGIKVIPIYNKSYLFKASDKEKWNLIKIFEELNLKI